MEVLSDIGQIIWSTYFNEGYTHWNVNAAYKKKFAARIQSVKNARSGLYQDIQLRYQTAKQRIFEFSIDIKSNNERGKCVIAIWESPEKSESSSKSKQCDVGEDWKTIRVRKMTSSGFEHNLRPELYFEPTEDGEYPEFILKKPKFQRVKSNGELEETNHILNASFGELKGTGMQYPFKAWDSTDFRHRLVPRVIPTDNTGRGMYRKLDFNANDCLVYQESYFTLSCNVASDRPAEVLLILREKYAGSLRILAEKRFQVNNRWKSISITGQGSRWRSQYNLIPEINFQTIGAEYTIKDPDLYRSDGLIISGKDGELVCVKQIIDSLRPITKKLGKKGFDGFTPEASAQLNEDEKQLLLNISENAGYFYTANMKLALGLSEDLTVNEKEAYIAELTRQGLDEGLMEVWSSRSYLFYYGVDPPYVKTLVFQPVHQMAIEQVLADKIIQGFGIAMGTPLLTKLKEQQDVIDQQQSAADQYKHAMLGTRFNGEEVGQLVRDLIEYGVINKIEQDYWINRIAEYGLDRSTTIKLANAFIKSSLKKAIAAYRDPNLSQDVKIQRIARHLGNALHTVQDGTCPVHKFMPFWGILRFWKLPSHILGENMYPAVGTSERELLDGGTQWIWDIFADSINGKLKSIPDKYFDENQRGPTHGDLMLPNRYRTKSSPELPNGEYDGDQHTYEPEMEEYVPDYGSYDYPQDYGIEEDASYWGEIPEYSYWPEYEPPSPEPPSREPSPSEPLIDPDPDIEADTDKEDSVSSPLAFLYSGGGGGGGWNSGGGSEPFEGDDGGWDYDWDYDDEWYWVDIEWDWG